MKFKPLSTWCPAIFLLIAGSVHADPSPYSISIGETVEHESNIFHAPTPTADWLSTTELRGAVDQTFGREHLIASAAFDLNRYKHDHQNHLNNSGYELNGELDWATVYDLSGSLGGGSSRKLYIYGLDGESATLAHNVQTTNNVFARAQVGGVSRWTLFGGLDASQRNYSDSTFAPNEVRQWGVDLGTRYHTSPDLSFGVVANLTKGRYPHAVLQQVPVEIIGSEDFTKKSLDFTSTLQASGNSSFDLRAGYSIDESQVQADRKYWNGDIKWNWLAGGRIKFVTELERNTDADATVGSTGSSTASNLTGRSINTTARLEATYELTAKINLAASGQYTQRRYAQGTLPIKLGDAHPTDGAGSNRTTQFSVAAHYQPLNNTDLSCSFSREVRRTDSQISLITPAYAANNALCSASIQFR